ncbi:MAG: POTRA domain-containing protein [Ignavibacteria bacterium]|nr:POTRA domain-containing protein [Ignavibacteria bacterium]
MSKKNMNYHLKLLFLLLVSGLSVLVPSTSTAQIPISSDLSPFDYSRPTEMEIGGVKVNGVKYLDESVLVMLSGLSVGDKIKVPGDKITESIRKLWEQGLFESITIASTNIQGNLIFLEINLKERPRISKFSFDGLRKSEADDIRTKINLTRGDVATDHLFVKTKNIIKAHYAEKGYLFADVDISTVPDPSRENYVDLTIKIVKNT